MRTICLGGEERGVYITTNGHYGKGSVVAVFIVADGRKCLKSRAFGQKEKAGNFYQNYLPFMAEGAGFEPAWTFALTVFKTAPL